MKKESNRKSLFYGFSSVLLLLLGLSGFLPIKTITFNYWHIIFLIVGIVGLISYFGIDIKYKSPNGRSFTVNLISAIFCLVGMIIIPSLIAIFLNLYIKNEQVCVIIGDIIFIAIIYLMYKNDLNYEAKTYFKDFKNKFKYSFKIYILGYMAMIFFNLIITLVLHNISQNESQVRELLYNHMVTTMINISILAPILEELVFRKSISPLIKNRWVYVVISGLLFGGAHILTNFIQGTFVISDLLYILPYACLGGSFALMDFNTKTTFSSMIIHALHNTLTAGLLLITFFWGK